MIASALLIAACLSLAFAMFCRLRLTTVKTNHHIRWSIVSVFVASLCVSVAPFVWQENEDVINAVLILCVVYMQWAFGHEWDEK